MGKDSANGADDGQEKIGSVFQKEFCKAINSSSSNPKVGRFEEKIIKPYYFYVGPGNQFVMTDKLTDEDAKMDATFGYYTRNRDNLLSDTHGTVTPLGGYKVRRLLILLRVREKRCRA